MADVSIRELRNNGGEVVDRAMRGERLTITRDGKPVAQLTSARRSAVPLDELLLRWRRLPPVDASSFRSDVDAVIDPSL